MNSRQTIFFFCDKCFIYGTGVGGLIGTLIAPVSGAMGGGFCGAAFGLFWGIVFGIGVALYNWLFLRYDTDAQNYRRRLVKVIGGIPAGTLLLLPVVIGLGYVFTHLTTSVPFTTVFWGVLVGELILLPPSFLVLLAFGEVGAKYAHRHFAVLRKRKNDEVVTPVVIGMNLLPREASFRVWARAMLKYGRWLVAFCLLVAGVLMLVDDSTRLISEAIIMVGLFAAYIGLIIVLLTWLNLFVIQTLNHLYFDEYVPHLTMEQYRRRVMGIAFVITLIGSLVVTVGIGAIPSAIVAALAARDYAAWRYGETEEREKSKLKPDFA